MTALDFADRHPVMVSVLAVLVFVGAVALVGFVVMVLVLAQVRVTEEEARAKPQYFALVGFCKHFGPVIVGGGKWAAGVLGTFAAQQLVDHAFGPGIKVPALTPSLGPPPPSPAPTLPDIDPGGST